MQDRASIRKTNQNSEIDTGNRSSDYHKTETNQKPNEPTFVVPSQSKSDATFNFNNAPTDYGRKNDQFQAESNQNEPIRQQQQPQAYDAHTTKNQQSSSNTNNFYGAQNEAQPQSDRICLKTQKGHQEEQQQPERVSFMKKKAELEPEVQERVSFAKRRGD